MLGKFRNIVIALQKILWPQWLPLRQGDQMSLWTSRPKCSPTHFVQNKYLTGTLGKSSSKICSTAIIFEKLPFISIGWSQWAKIRPIWSPCSETIIISRPFRGCAQTNSNTKRIGKSRGQRQVSNLVPRSDLWSPGVKLPPWGELCPLAVKFAPGGRRSSLRPS
jgi:hypothetical protein